MRGRPCRVVSLTGAWCAAIGGLWSSWSPKPAGPSWSTGACGPLGSSPPCDPPPAGVLLNLLFASLFNLPCLAVQCCNRLRLQTTLARFC